MKLHASGEDYLEAILVLHKKIGMVRSVDVARHRNVMPCLPAWSVHQGKCSQRHNSMRRLGERSICLGPHRWRILSGV